MEQYNLMTEKARLQRVASEAQAELWAIEKTERDRRNASLIGKCLRYRNSYGHDEGWWLYCKVLRAEDGDLVVHRFETTSNGEIRIEPEKREYTVGRTDGWKPIPTEDFDQAWQKLMSSLSALNR